MRGRGAMIAVGDPMTMFERGVGGTPSGGSIGSAQLDPASLGRLSRLTVTEVVCGVPRRNLPTAVQTDSSMSGERTNPQR